MRGRDDLASLPLVALVGAANSGKTTLFNLITASHYDTVNYPGSTVEFTLGEAARLPGFPCRVMDTPGLSSLAAVSPDERVTVNALFDGTHRPDLVVCVVDGNQLSRHLYLARQLQAVGFAVAVAVTMQDRLRSRGLQLHVDRLSELIDCPVLALDPRQRTALKPLEAMLIRTRQAAGDRACPEAESLRRTVATFDEERIEQVFRALDAVEKIAVQPAGPPGAAPPTRTPFSVDRILLHPVLGLVLFLLVMTAIFTSIFWLAAPFMNAIDAGFGWAISALKTHLPATWATDFLADGLIGGIGAVAVYVPQILILFVAMGYLEDSGYLARGAALVDKPLSKIGLNGKSFVPLLSGYACAIPAMMAARTISNRAERNLTLLVIPMMSCSARLPIYTLLLAFLLPQNKPWIGGLALTGLYVLGMVLGAIISTVASRFIRSGEASRFILELPAMKRPVFRVVLSSTYHKTMVYARKAGLAIVIISSALWVLTHTPSPHMTGPDPDYVTLSHSYAADIGHVIEPITRPMGLDWRGGVALICGTAAREVFVSALALAYRVHGEKDKGLTGHLLAAMPSLRFEDTGQRIFTTASSLGLLVFYIIALQCFATVAVARHEMGSWKLAIGQLVLFTGTAYALAVATVQGLRALGVA